MYTKCEHCHTRFRIKATQLSLAQGMVRCGRCRQVFNAMLNLSDNTAKPEVPLKTPSSFVTLTQSQELTQSQIWDLSRILSEPYAPNQATPAAKSPAQKPRQPMVARMKKNVKLYQRKAKKWTNAWMEKIKAKLGSEKNVLFTDDDSLLGSSKSTTKGARSQLSLGVVDASVYAVRKAQGLPATKERSTNAVIDYQSVVERKTQEAVSELKKEKARPKTAAEQQTQTVLNMLVNDVQNPWLRAAAVRGLDDQSVLSEVAINDTRAVVRLAALEKITSKALLASIAKTDPDEAVRGAAMAKLKLKKIS